jgi:hypothetical protein
VDLVDNVDLGATMYRHVPNGLSKIADVLHRVVGGTIHLDHIRTRACEDLLAAGTFPARIRGWALLAVECTGKGPSCCGLADASWT